MQRSEALANLTEVTGRLFAFVDEGGLKRVLRETPREQLAGHAPQHRLSIALIEQLVREYSAGDSVYMLAARHGIHRNSIARALRDAECVMRRDPMKPTEIERAKALSTQSTRGTRSGSSSDETRRQ